MESNLYIYIADIRRFQFFLIYIIILIIYMTDLFGNEINENTKIILIRTKDNLQKLSTNIYGYNIEKIKLYLESLGLNINNYRFLYHIYTENIDNVKYFIMAHVKITRKPLDYIIIKKYYDGYIYRPESYDKYHSFGLLYNTQIPNNPYFSLISSDYLLNIVGNVYDLGSLNEFSSMTHPSSIQYTVIRSQKKEIILDKLNKIKLENGNIILNNKCLTNKNNYASLDECEEKYYSIDHNINHTRQNWYLFNTMNGYNIVSQFDNKCLTPDNTIGECNSKNTFKELKEKILYKGNKVKLIESDDPWHSTINNDTEEENEDMGMNNNTQINMNEYNAPVPETNKVKKGYSFRDRIEQFGNNQNKSDLITIFIICFILILLVYKRKN